MGPLHNRPRQRRALGQRGRQGRERVPEAARHARRRRVGGDHGRKVHCGGAEDQARPDATPPLRGGDLACSLGGRAARGSPPRIATQFGVTARRRQVLMKFVNHDVKIKMMLIAVATPYGTIDFV